MAPSRSVRGRSRARCAALAVCPILAQGTAMSCTLLVLYTPCTVLTADDHPTCHICLSSLLSTPRTMHHLTFQFCHFPPKVLFDIGVLDHSEPFTRLVHQGMILGTDGEKMSKSRGNVINPDDVVNEYGAVSLAYKSHFYTVTHHQEFKSHLIRCLIVV